MAAPSAAGVRLFPLLLLLPAASPEPRPGPSGAPGPGLCSLPMAVGRCRAAVPRFWFNSTGGSCQGFTYGGCDGNANNFPTEQECRERCALRRSLPGPSAASTYAEHCLVPALTGPCRAAFPRWFYSPRDGDCRRFTYGGCRGNRNNYGSREECWRRCGRGDDGGGFWTGVGSVKALALGVAGLLAASALIGCGAEAALGRCRKRKQPFPPAGGARGDDTERLMGGANTL
ncbi:kunitz-type protease inhibitor 2 [Guaruba guarouba]